MGLLDLFKRETPEEAVRRWQGELRKEMRAIERQVADIQREQKKTEKSIRDCLKRNDKASAKHLARTLVQSRNAVSRLHQSKAQMNSVSLQLRENLATSRALGHLQKSAGIMQQMNALIKLPELGKSLQELAKEMMKAGVIGEMVDDAMSSALDSEDLESETELQVDQVLAELAVETAVAMPSAGRKVPAQTQGVAAAQQAAEEEEFASLQARLDAIRAT